MLSVAEARHRLIAMLHPVADTEVVSLADAAGRVLAGDVQSAIASPLFSNSSMDGFAVIADDVKEADSANPVKLRVVSDIPAGKHADKSLERGQAMRIMTGAPLPDGADAVVPVEKTDVQSRDTQASLPSKIEVYLSVPSGAYVRERGEDFPEGALVLRRGSRLRAQDIGMLAMQGTSEVGVYRRPKVGLLSTGDELVPIEEELAPGKIRDTNSYTLGALVAGCGCETVNLGIARDTLQDVEAALRRAKEQKVDLIVSSAGVSVGAYDYVRAVVEKHGRVNFWRVNMRPGKPLTVGEYSEIPFVGLPGNPVSSFIGFEVFLRPALHHLAGVLQWARVTHKVRMADSVESDGRESYLRVELNANDGRMQASLTGHQGSGNLYSLVLADGLVVVPAGVGRLSEGAEVEYWSFSSS